MAKTEMQAGNAKQAASTQAYVDIAEVKQNTLIMKDGSMRAVLVVSSTNFSLKSTDEQNALISSYQNFLNSLDFPIQIVMQSRKLDINVYLEKLRGIMQQQTNELLRMQTQEYIEYIAKLIEFASIMTKTFYIVVPLSLGAAKKGGIFSGLSGLFNPAGQVSAKETKFELAHVELEKRINQVQGNLGSMGLKSIVLQTEELVELMYNSYNFSSTSPIKIKNINDLGISG